MNTLGFGGHTTSVVTSQLSQGSVKIATHNLRVTELGCDGIKLYLHKQALGWVWLIGHSLHLIYYLG